MNYRQTDHSPWTRPSEGGRGRTSTNLLMTLIGSLLCGVTLLLADAGHAVVLAPIVASVLCTVMLYRSVAGASAPMNEIGAYYLAAVSLYSVVPLAAYLARGMVFSPYNDSRLLVFNPTAQEMAEHGWKYATYIAAFVATYMLVRDKKQKVERPLGLPSSASIRVALVLVLLIQGGVIAFSSVYGVEAENYAEWNANQAAMLQQVPLLLRQVMDHTEKNMLVLKIFLLVLLFARYRKHRTLIWVWMGLEVTLAVVRLGARTPAVLACLAAVFLYHRFVRPISHLRALVFAMFLVSGFMVVGTIRSLGSMNAVGLSDASNEFEVLFATGLDIQRRAALGSLPPAPLGLRFADVLGLVPSQVLSMFGVQKITGPEWYLGLVGLSGAGIGLGFGPLAESAIGFGWPELILRGAFVGLVFASLQNWYNRHVGGFWETVLFVWVVLNCYTSVRSSTGQMLALMALQFVPGFAVLRLFDAGRKRQRGAEHATTQEWLPMQVLRGGASGLPGESAQVS